MITGTGLVAVVVLAVFAVTLPPFRWTSRQAAPRAAQTASTRGIHVSGSTLVDGNGHDFLIRGTNYDYAAYPDEITTVSDIKSFGANTVRVVLSNGRFGRASASDVANIIIECRTNRLICVLDDHDTTGYAEEGGASTLAQAVQYWIDLRRVLQGEDNYVVINIGNEPYGNYRTSSWTNDTINAIKAMRSAGFRHALMIDAPNWGQDYQFVMRDNAPAVAAADPEHNTIFSVHMYGIFNTAAKITSYVSAFTSRNLPLAIGEFGHNHTDGNPDEDAIMATASAQRIGYLGWSWSGNGGGLDYLDEVTDFDPKQQTWWGRRLFSGVNGIRSSAREATVYRGRR